MTAPSGRKIAASRWPDVRIVGAGRWAVVGCVELVTLASTPTAAAAIATRLDRFSCGPACRRSGHAVVRLDEGVSA